MGGGGGGGGGGGLIGGGGFGGGVGGEGRLVVNLGSGLFWLSLPGFYSRPVRSFPSSPIRKTAPMEGL